MNTAVIHDIESLIVIRIKQIGISPVLYKDFSPIRDHYNYNKKQIINTLNHLVERGVLTSSVYGVRKEPCWFWTRASLELFN